MIEQSKLEAAIHHYLVRGLIDHGFAPDIGTLQKMVKADATTVRNGLKRLEASHSLVCHPGSASPWVIHPFLAQPHRHVGADGSAGVVGTMHLVRPRDR